MDFVNTESTAGNDTWKLNVKAVNATEEVVKNDTRGNVGSTMPTEGVNSAMSALMTMSIVTTQYSKN